MRQSSGRRLRPSRRFLRYKERQPRMKLSRDDLLKYLRDRGIRHKGDLEKKRKEDEPNRYDFLKEFGKWSDAVLMAFGPPLPTGMDRAYILNCVNHLNAWDVERFRELRRKMPYAVPSWRVVIRIFGSYSNLFREAREQTVQVMLFEYQKLIRRIGRIPTVSEVREASLNLDKLIAFYKGKKELDSFVAGLMGLKS